MFKQCTILLLLLFTFLSATEKKMVMDQPTQQDHSKPMTLSLKGEKLYCNKPFKSADLYTTLGKHLAYIENSENSHVISIPNNFAPKVYMARVKGLDNTISVSKITTVTP